jgi:hypothetical protein
MMPLGTAKTSEEGQHVAPLYRSQGARTDCEKRGMEV